MKAANDIRDRFRSRKPCLQWTCWKNSWTSWRGRIDFAQAWSRPNHRQVLNHLSRSRKYGGLRCCTILCRSAVAISSGSVLAFVAGV